MELTPIKMAAAYGIFGNYGLYTEPVLYTKVHDKTGNVILESSPAQKNITSPKLLISI